MIPKVPSVSEERRFIPISSTTGVAVESTGWEYCIVFGGADPAGYVPVPEVLGSNSTSVQLAIDLPGDVVKGVYTVWLSRMVGGKRLERRALVIERN